MSRLNHAKLKNERVKLLSSKFDNIIVQHKGKYSWTDTLIMQNSELYQIAKRAAEILDDYAKISMSNYGDEYQKVCEVLKDLNSYLKESQRVTTTGVDWRAPEITKGRKTNTKTEQDYSNNGVFGRTWDQIEEMQGGKLNY